MVFLLLLPALELLVRVRDQDEVRHVAEDGVVLILAAHGDQAVLKSAGVLAHDDQRAVLQAVRAAGAGYFHLGQDPGKDPVSAGDLAAHLERLLDGAEHDLVAGVHDAEVRGRDVLVLLHDLQELLFVDGEDPIAVARLVAELDVLDVEGSNLKSHAVITP